jgi:hypothetical protein
MNIEYRYRTIANGEVFEFTSNKPNLQFAVSSEWRSQFAVSSEWANSGGRHIVGAWVTRGTAQREYARLKPETSPLLTTVDYVPRTKLLVPKDRSEKRRSLSTYTSHTWELYDGEEYEVIDTSKWTVPMWELIKYQLVNGKKVDLINHLQAGVHDWADAQWRKNSLLCKECGLVQPKAK